MHVVWLDQYSKWSIQGLILVALFCEFISNHWQQLSSGEGTWWFLKELDNQVYHMVLHFPLLQYCQAVLVLTFVFLSWSNRVKNTMYCRLIFSFNWSFGGFFQQIKISSQVKFQWTNGIIRYGMESTILLIQWCVICTTPSRYLRQIVTLRVLLKKIIWTCLIKYFMAFKWIKSEDYENLTKSQKHMPTEHPEGLLFSLNLANHINSQCNNIMNIKLTDKFE